MELVVQDDAVTIIGHSGLDPGIAGTVSHYRSAGMTTVALSNYDDGLWKVCTHLAEFLGLNDPRE